MFAVENVVIPWKYVSQQTIGTMHFGSLSRPLVPAQVVLSVEFRIIESCLVLDPTTNAPWKAQNTRECP